MAQAPRQQLHMMMAGGEQQQQHHYGMHTSLALSHLHEDGQGSPFDEQQQDAMGFDGQQQQQQQPSLTRSWSEGGGKDKVRKGFTGKVKKFRYHEYVKFPCLSASLSSCLPVTICLSNYPTPWSRFVHALTTYLPAMFHCLPSCMFRCLAACMFHCLHVLLPGCSARREQ